MILHAARLLCCASPREGSCLGGQVIVSFPGDPLNREAVGRCMRSHSSWGAALHQSLAHRVRLMCRFLGSGNPVDLSISMPMPAPP